MEISQTTISLVDELETHSEKRLSYKRELCILVELAHRHQRIPMLEQLSFFAKFTHKAFGILQRTGKESEGHDRLTAEFEDGIRKTKAFLNDLLIEAAIEIQRQFATEFLTLTPTAFQNLLTLCYDLSWYKNFQIDRRRS